jgi:hypothetical protein
LPAGLGEADAPHAPHTPLTSDKAPATPNAATPRRLVVCEDRFLSPGMSPPLVSDQQQSAWLDLSSGKIGRLSTSELAALCRSRSCAIFFGAELRQSGPNDAKAAVKESHRERSCTDGYCREALVFCWNLVADQAI